MKDLLTARIGKDVDIQCIGALFSGKVVRVEGDVVVLEKDDRVGFINLNQIVAIWDKSEKKTKSPGFTPKAD